MSTRVDRRRPRAAAPRRPRGRIASLLLLAIAGFLGAAAARPVAAQAGDAGDAAVHPLAALVGPTWSVRGTELATGERMDADLVFTALFGGAVIHERTTVRLADGDVRLGFVHETLHGAPTEDGTFGFVTVGSDGSVMEGRGRRVDETVVAMSTDRRTDAAARGHRTLALVDGTLRWIIERGDGEERTGLMDARLRAGGAGSLAIPAAVPDGPAQRLRPFIGTWTTEATWSTGETLAGRNVFRMGRGAGYAMVDTYASDGGGPEYHRYAAIHVRDPERGWMGYSADFSGALSAVPLTLRDTPDGLAIDTRSTMAMGGASAEIDQTSAITGPDTFRWVVRMRPLPTGEEPGPWSDLMDATWDRAGRDGGRPGNGSGDASARDEAAGAAGSGGTDAAADPAAAKPIDPALFDVRGDPGRWFTVTEVVPATPARCFELWTTAAGITAFMGIEADIELAVGGRYEWIMLPDAPAGQRGSEGCQVLAWVPDRLLAFTWSAPPSQPASRARRGWVTITFDALDPAADGSPRTRVRLDHAGLGEAAHWRETEAYFRRAWPSVLTAMRRHLEAAADDGA